MGYLIECSNTRCGRSTDAKRLPVKCPGCGKLLERGEIWKSKGDDLGLENGASGQEDDDARQESQEAKGKVLRRPKPKGPKAPADTPKRGGDKHRGKRAVPRGKKSV